MQLRETKAPTSVKHLRIFMQFEKTTEGRITKWKEK
jgi:hypothetical protein